MTDQLIIQHDISTKISKKKFNVRFFFLLKFQKLGDFYFGLKNETTKVLKSTKIGKLELHSNIFFNLKKSDMLT